MPLYIKLENIKFYVLKCDTCRINVLYFKITSLLVIKLYNYHKQATMKHIFFNAFLLNKRNLSKCLVYVGSSVLFVSAHVEMRRFCVIYCGEIFCIYV